MNSSYLFLNSLRFHYLQWNTAGNGLPVICHHGLASNARIWEMVAPYLGAQGFRVYSLDARGHGLTDKPDNGYDTETITRDLAAFINACHLERPLLIGHSWGANIILNYAARVAFGPHAPSGIVLVDGGITQLDDQGTSWEVMEQRLTPPDLAGMPMDEFARKLRDWNADWSPSDQVISIFMDNFDISEDELISPRLTRNHHMRIVRAIWDFKTFEYFNRVNCPVLMVPVLPNGIDSSGHLAAKERGVEKARLSIHDLTVSWMKNSIHDIPVQHPAELARVIIDFAAGIRPKSKFE